MKTIFTLLSLLFISCGAKTVNMIEKKTDSTQKDIAVIKIDSASKNNTLIKFDINTEEVVIEAVDTTKPIEITNSNGKVVKYKNARLSNRKTKDNTVVANNKTTSKTVIDSTNKEIKINVAENAELFHKEQFSWSKLLLDLWWLWLLFLLIVYVFYRYIKR
jgi:hypothetical protein